MLVKEWMKTKVVTVDAADSMANAMKLLKEKQIRLLPVMEYGKLVGVITDRDIKKASASDATTLDVHELNYLISKIKVKEIMTAKPISVKPEFTIEETAELLLKHKISGVPVTDAEGDVLGVITQSDMFKVLISLTGLPKRGVQFAFKVENHPGAVQLLIDIIRKYGGRIMNVLVSMESTDDPFIKAYIRMYGIDRARFSSLKDELRQKATLLYMVDYFENKRELYF